MEGEEEKVPGIGCCHGSELADADIDKDCEHLHNDKEQIDGAGESEVEEE